MREGDGWDPPPPHSLNWLIEIDIKGTVKMIRTLPKFKVALKKLFCENRIDDFESVHI